MANCVSSDELMHYGVLGMKWGVHRVKKAPILMVLHGLQKDMTKRCLEGLCIM